MFGLAGMMGGGGGGLQSSAKAESSARTGDTTLGDMRFGDTTVGGLKFNPWTLAIIGAAILAGLWIWKH